MSSLIDDISNGVRLNSLLFSRKNHIGILGYSSAEVWDHEENIPRKPWEYIGWCPASATEKPESNWQSKDFTLAVMLFNKYNVDRDDEKVWLHVKPSDKEVAAAFKFYGPAIYDDNAGCGHFTRHTIPTIKKLRDKFGGLPGWLD